MAWPKGVPRNTDRKEGFPIPEGASISVERRAKPSLANKQFDPWTKFKTEPEKFYYRGIPQRVRERSIREAEGYEPIKGTEYGDLVLARLPKEIQQENIREQQEKTRNQNEAVMNQFKEEAAQVGVKTFEET